MASFCPLTGFAIYTRPEWTNRRVSEAFTVNFWVIGDNIIYCLPRGRPSAESIREAFAINDEVVEYVSKTCEQHVQIEDYAFISGSDAETRRVFVNTIDARDRLSAIVFCNLSIALSIAVNIGSRMNVRNKGVHVAKHYKAAVQLVLEKYDAQPANTHSPINLSGFVHETTTSIAPVDTCFSEALNLDLPGWRLNGVLIDHSVLHTTNYGSLGSRHIPLLDDYHRQVDDFLGDDHHLGYIVVNIAAVEGATHGARIEYMRCLRRWHQRSPFRMYIAYGANTRQRTALVLGNALMPFKVRVVKNLKHAFEMISEDKLQTATDPTVGTQASGSPQVVAAEDLQGFLAYIGRINWESEGLDDHYNIEVDHPFFLLYQSVELIKEEIDTLFDERKQFEEQLYQARKMESVGTFAAGIAHDINNILCIISGNTQLALSDIDADSSIRTYLTDVSEAAGRAEGVVKQLLDFSRTRDQRYKPLDAVAVFRDALRLLRATIPATVEIKERFPDTPINICSDATQLNQILMNLFANAAQAMEDTGGALEICISNEFVMDGVMNRSPGRSAGEYLKLTVSDTGPGISPEYIDRIFDPYFTTKEVGRGSGMGLAVVLGIVKMHGGTITVNSQPHSGTTFTLLFPTVNEQPATKVEPTSALPLGDESILLVEDEPAVIKVIENILARLGYRVVANADPLAALERFRSEPERFDLIISDMTMPMMTGVELAAEVKAIRADIPVVICTGYSPLIDDDKAEQLGISALATKPLEMRSLAAIVRQVLDEETIAIR